MNTKNKIGLAIAAFSFILIVGQSSCKVPESITSKSGSQLWSENCSRCHNSPSAGNYKNEQWEVIGTHMKIKAGLTDKEVTKIVDFLKQ